MVQGTLEMAINVHYTVNYKGFFMETFGLFSLNKQYFVNIKSTFTLFFYHNIANIQINNLNLFL